MPLFASKVIVYSFAFQIAYSVMFSAGVKKDALSEYSSCAEFCSVAHPMNVFPVFVKVFCVRALLVPNEKSCVV